MAEKRIARFICFSLLRFSNEAATELAHRRVNETRGERTNFVLTLSHYPISVRHPHFQFTPLVTAKPHFINEKIRFDELSVDNLNKVEMWPQGDSKKHTLQRQVLYHSEYNKRVLIGSDF